MDCIKRKSTAVKKGFVTVCYAQVVTKNLQSQIFQPIICSFDIPPDLLPIFNTRTSRDAYNKLNMSKTNEYAKPYKKGCITCQKKINALQAERI